MLSLHDLDHRLPTIARQIHAIRRAAYKQEAELLAVAHFPPLERSLEDVLNSCEAFVGASQDSELVGVVSTCADDEGRGINISSLVVHPAHQRRGFGIALVRAVVQRYAGTELTVQTAAANAPALSLYAHLGFREYRRWTVGQEALELVKLSLSAASVRGAA